MLRVILAILAGFLVMGILGLGADLVLSRLLPGQFALGEAPRDESSLFLVLAYTLIFCGVSGYVTAANAGRLPMVSTIGLGLLIAIATLVNMIITPEGLPLWWKVLGGLLCGPFTVLGGWLRARKRS